jgi:hypothetical protein
MSTPTEPYIRLYLVPFNGQQQILDVPSTSLILSNGQFVSVQVAPSVTLMGVPVQFNFTPFDQAQLSQVLEQAQTQELRICWREPEDIQQYPDTDVIMVTDPTGGQCLCGLTCSGTQLSYVQVYNVPVTV